MGSWIRRLGPGRLVEPDPWSPGSAVDPLDHGHIALVEAGLAIQLTSTGVEAMDVELDRIAAVFARVRRDLGACVRRPSVRA